MPLKIPTEDISKKIDQKHQYQQDYIVKTQIKEGTEHQTSFNVKNIFKVNKLHESVTF